jgi:hypothetical protein
MHTNNILRMTIAGGGNVGIGTTAPATLLEVAGAITMNPAVAGGTSTYFDWRNNGSTFAYSGSAASVVGGGAANDFSPGWCTGANSLIFGTSNAAKMKLDSGGTLTVSADLVAYGSPSDKKLKENIHPIENALEKVIKLQGVKFDWKKSESILDLKEDMGFIAQDVKKVVPELVRENEDGLLSMRHQGVIPILVEAIKEQQKQIDSLQEQIKKMSSEN